MGIRYIRKHINEGIFKNPEQAKAAKDRLAQRSNAEKVAAAAKAEIPGFVEKEYAKEVEDALAGDSSSVFDYSYNQARCKGVRFYLDSGILICESHINLGGIGYYLHSSADINILIRYPEIIRHMEEDISKKYEIPCKFKIVITKDFEDEKPLTPGTNWFITFEATMTKDFTDFCHLLNACEGLNWDHNYTIRIDFNRNTYVKSVKTISTKEPLKKKFQGMYVVGTTFYKFERLSDILSTEVSNEYMQMKPLYRGRTIKTAIPTNYTSYVEMFHEGKMIDSIDYNTLKNVIIDCAHFSRNNPEFKNICFRIDVFGKWSGASYPTNGLPLFFGKEMRELQDSVKNVSAIINLYNGNGKYPVFNQVAIEGKDNYSYE